MKKYTAAAEKPLKLIDVFMCHIVTCLNNVRSYAERKFL